MTRDIQVYEKTKSGTRFIKNLRYENKSKWKFKASASTLNEVREAAEKALRNKETDRVEIIRGSRTELYQRKHLN